MDEQSNNLIAILDQKKASVEENRDVLANIIISVQNILERYYNKDNAFVKQATLLHEYVLSCRLVKKTNILCILFVIQKILQQTSQY